MKKQSQACPSPPTRDLNSLLIPEGQWKRRRFSTSSAAHGEEEDAPLPRRLALRKAAVARARATQKLEHQQQQEPISTLV